MTIKKILWIFVFLCLAISVNARLGTFEQGTCVDLVTSLSASTVELSVLKGPGSNTIISDVAMSQNGTLWNYTTCQTNQTGIYTYGFCDDAGNCYSNDFLINRIGNEEDKDFTATAFFIGLALVMAIFVYLKFSKLFGSVMFMVVGLGMMYTSPANGWIGWVILASGIIMFIWTLVEKPKRRYR